MSRFTDPTPSTPKCNRKFEILIVEIFSLEQKPNKIYTNKSNCVSPRKQPHFFFQTKTFSFV